MREILKQSQYTPHSLAIQVALIYAGTKGFLDEVPLNKLHAFKEELIVSLKNNDECHFCIELNDKKVLTNKLEEDLAVILEKITKNYVG